MTQEKDEAWKEPEIIVNGVRLNNAQAMTVRVSLQTMALGLQSGLGDDETGRKICDGYLAAIGQVNRIMHL